MARQAHFIKKPQSHALVCVRTEKWAQLVSGAIRRIKVPFAQPYRGQEGAKVAGSLDWREKGVVMHSVLNTVRKDIEIAMSASGQRLCGVHCCDQSVAYMPHRLERRGWVP
jgi:hypothetical protein